MRRHADHDPAHILRADAAGDVVRSTRIERDPDLWWDMVGEPVLPEALIVGHTAYDAADRRMRSLTVRGCPAPGPGTAGPRRCGLPSRYREDRAGAVSSRGRRS
ncbi:hypothetical protein [Nocardiopsis sp. NPDC055824]